MMQMYLLPVLKFKKNYGNIYFSSHLPGLANFNPCFWEFDFGKVLAQTQKVVRICNKNLTKF